MLPNIIKTVLIAQSICALIFVLDFTASVFDWNFLNIPWMWLEIIEILALVVFITGIGLTVIVLRQTLVRNQKVEDQLLVASGEFHKLLEQRFDEWELSPAERDVALMTIKGLSLNEVAMMRNVSEGTIKSQSAAIYKKAGVTGRLQLISGFVEDMVASAPNAARA